MTGFPRESLERLNKWNRAIEQIAADYGDRVSVAQKNKQLVKFGVNESLGTTEEMIWSQGGIEVLPSSGNPIDTISSSDVGDTQEVKIEGHTIDGNGDLTFVVQDATLNGQNKVTLDTPLYRATRMYNNDASDFSGDIYVYEDTAISAGVPSDATKIHLKILIGNNQSLKAATSVSAQDYWLIGGITIGVNRQTSRAVEFKFQVKEQGKVFRTRFYASGNSDAGSIHIPFEQCLIVPKNSDFRVLGTSTGTTTGAEATAHGYLAKII